MAIARYLVHDVEESIAFYQDVLGFTVRQHFGPPFASMDRGDLQLWLAGPAASARKPMPDGREPEPGGWNRIVVEVDDIEAVVADLRARGASFRNEPLQGPGGTQVLIDDPSGNPIEIFQPAEPA
jgi:catechol 2,3-dioxygenase-like lactoylglutathione lyase family enzyme